MRRLSELDGWAIGLGILSLIGVTITNRALPEPFNVAGLSDFPILLASAYFCARLVGERIPPHAMTIFACFLAIFGLYFIGLIVDGSIIAIKNLLGIVIAGSFFFYFERLGRMSRPSYHSVVALLSFALLCLVMGTMNKNALSGTAGYLILTAGIITFSLIRRPSLVAPIFFILMAMTALLMNHRTLVAMSGGGLLVYFFLRAFPWRINRMLILAVTVMGIFLFIALYIGMFGLNIRDYNAIFIEYTGRNAVSGRQWIWPVVVREVTSTDWGLWFGLGTGEMLDELSVVHLSAHSYYLQTFMQAGIVGLVLLGSLLFSLWQALGKAGRRSPLRHFMTAIMLIVIVHSATETFLMQANLAIAINVWAALGLGLGLLTRSASQVGAGARPVRVAQSRRDLPRRPLPALNRTAVAD